MRLRLERIENANRIAVVPQAIDGVRTDQAGAAGNQSAPHDALPTV